jgi:aryl-alcohol dehydrogenase-like predicted oxidoreductase
MKIALGSVQFGLNYGVSNVDGQVSSDEVSNILNAAQSHHIQFIDTAVGYGNSESVLGEYLQQNPNKNFHIVTKTPPIASMSQSMSTVVDNSLKRLHCSKLYGLLLHDPSEINDEIYAQLVQLKNEEKVKKIGVSVYSPEQAFNIVDKYDINLIQLPFNIFDQRFTATGCLQYLKDKNIEIHSRSLFLQGLLLQPLSSLNSYFSPYYKQLQAFHKLAKHHNCSPLALALSLIHSNESIDRFVVGVCSQQQLNDIVKSVCETANKEIDYEHLISTDENLINPTFWDIQ